MLYSHHEGDVVRVVRLYITYTYFVFCFYQQKPQKKIKFIIIIHYFSSNQFTHAVV